MANALRADAPASVSGIVLFFGHPNHWELAAYDFSGFGTIVGVGGGHGRLLAAILRNAPRARGVLFDAERVVAGAAVLDPAGVADRTAVVGGFSFESVPSGGDAYVLKHVVHDWDESKVLEILRNVRNAMSAGAKLLVIETVIPDDDREHLSKLLIWKCWSPAPARNVRPRSTRGC